MYDDATWFPVCAGLSALGVVAAFFAFRRRGAAAGLRLFGWAVLPMAIYLTGMVRLLWTIGAALVKWVSGFAFSPYVWTGLALFGVAAICLPVAGAMRRRKSRSAEQVENGRTGARAAGAAGTVGAGGTAAGRTGTAKGADQPKAVGQGQSQPQGQSKGQPQSQPQSQGKAQGKGQRKGNEDDPLAGFEDIDEILKRRGIS